MPARRSALIGVIGSQSKLDEALHGADIVVTATWAEEPFIFRRHLRPGMHITTLGADQSGKCEVASDALRAARVIVDDRALTVATGAAGNAGLGADAVHAELGEIVAGIKPGRVDDGEITVFPSVGLAFQDLAAGWLAYRRAKGPTHPSVMPPNCSSLSITAKSAL